MFIEHYYPTFTYINSLKEPFRSILINYYKYANSLRRSIAADCCQDCLEATTQEEEKQSQAQSPKEEQQQEPAEQPTSETTTKETIPQEETIVIPSQRILQGYRMPQSRFQRSNGNFRGYKRKL